MLIPPTESPLNLPDTFADLFPNNILNIKEMFKEQGKHKTYWRKCTSFTTCLPLEKGEIFSIVNNRNQSICTIDLCNTK